MCQKDPYIKDSVAMVHATTPKVLPLMGDRGDYSRYAPVPMLSYKPTGSASAVDTVFRVC